MPGPVTKIIEAAASVSGPIGLLGLVAALVAISYWRYLSSKEKRLEALPKNQRFEQRKRWLGSLLGRSAEGMSEERVYKLIREEMSRRYDITKKLIYATTSIALLALLLAFSVSATNAQPSTLTLTEVVTAYSGTNQRTLFLRFQIEPIPTPARLILEYSSSEFFEELIHRRELTDWSGGHITVLVPDAVPASGYIRIMLHHKGTQTVSSGKLYEFGNSRPEGNNSE